MTNIAKWKIPTMNGGANSWENHLFRLGPSIPVRYVSHNQRVTVGYQFGICFFIYGINIWDIIFFCSLIL